MKKFTFWLLLMTLAASPLALAQATAAESAPPENEIRALLDAQVSAWNHGDLKGYMQGYWHSDELTFFAADTESTGWEAAYQRYRTAYQAKDKEMGRLAFSNLRVRVLAPDAAFVRGRWQLTMRNGGQRVGLFTIILQRFPEGWRIIHDHSS
jgi:beta-aspartyl-peptidase (threonine type)